MKRYALHFVLLVACMMTAYAALADQQQLPSGASANYARACAFDGMQNQTVSVTSASAATTNATGVGVVRIVCTQNAHVAFGSSPTATTSSIFIPQLSPEYMISNGHKLAFIRNSADGTCWVTECK